MAMKKTQTLVQLTSELLAALDETAVRTGRSRSDIIREAIEEYLDDIMSGGIDKQIIRGYRKRPQREDPWAEAMARESIAAEPW